MTGYECTNCHNESITKTIFCPRCGSKYIQSIDVPKIGKVYSFTTIYIAPPEYVDLAPYQIALVQLTEKLKITAFLQEEIRIGDSVGFKEMRNKAFIFTVET